MARLSQRSVYDELPEILEQRGITLRSFSADLGVATGHLSRALRRVDSKRLSPRLVAAAAQALELPADYWPEVREARLSKALSRNPDLRDKLYRRYASGEPDE